MRSNVSKWLDRVMLLRKWIKSPLAPRSIEGAKKCKAKRGLLHAEPSQKLVERYNIVSTDIAGTDCYVIGGGEQCVMYLHGGIYVNGITSWHFLYLTRLFRLTNCTIIVPMYGRTATDTATVVTGKMLELYEHLVKQYGQDNLTLMGDSAGGGLALTVANLALDNNIPQPRDIVLLSPWVDVTMTNPELVKHSKNDRMLSLNELQLFGAIYDEKSSNNWLANPINRIEKAMAPVFMLVGGYEMLLPDALRYKRLADEVGAKVTLHEYPQMQHDYILLPYTESVIATNMVAQLINRR